MPPPPPLPLPDPEPEEEEESTTPIMVESAIEEPKIYRTDRDTYGIAREYLYGKPSITPDKYFSLSDVSDSPYNAVDSPDLQQSNPTFPSPIQKFCEATTFVVQTIFSPFRNVSIYRLMTWFYNSSNTKSMSELNTLVKEVILAPDFQQEDFVGFSAQKEHALMDSCQDLPHVDSSLPALDDTWIEGMVELSVPCDGVKHFSEADAPKFSVKVYYRKLLDVIKAALLEPEAEKFHTFPFKESWQPSANEPDERIYSEIYTGDKWNDEYEKVHATNEQGPHHALEALIIALMIWSDSMSLAQFGNAQLWPIYLYIGNQSKYSRAKPSSFAAHHIAYMPKVNLGIAISRRLYLLML